MFKYLQMQSILVYLSAAVTKRYQCTQQDVQKIVGHNFPHAPSRARCIRRTKKNRQVTEEESYPEEIELENKGCNED